VPTLLEIGVTEELLLRCGLAMHIPLRPMLGGITRDLGEMLTKLTGREFTCEYKYDGTVSPINPSISQSLSLLTKDHRPASTSPLRFFRQSNNLLSPS
jgi:DNA ligase-1